MWWWRPSSSLPCLSLSSTSSSSKRRMKTRSSRYLSRQMIICALITGNSGQTISESLGGVLESTQWFNSSILCYCSQILSQALAYCRTPSRLPWEMFQSSHASSSYSTSFKQWWTICCMEIICLNLAPLSTQQMRITSGFMASFSTLECTRQTQIQHTSYSSLQLYFSPS